MVFHIMEFNSRNTKKFYDVTDDIISVQISLFLLWACGGGDIVENAARWSEDKPVVVAAVDPNNPVPVEVEPKAPVVLPNISAISR